MGKIAGITDKFFTAQVSKEETMTVGELKNIVSGLKEKAKEKNLNPKTVKKIVTLSNKYQQTINKTTLLYHKNKHKDQIKRYKVVQLSYAKILQLLGKNVVVNEKEGMLNGLKRGFTQHPVENSLMAIGATSALCGVMAKIPASTWKDIWQKVIKEALKFLFTDGMAPITIGGGLLAGVLITKAIRKAKEQNAVIKEEAEAKASRRDDHESEIEGATLKEDRIVDGKTILGKTSIANKAFKDPLYLEHITEVATNTTGAYTPTQIKNARAILKEVKNLKIAAQESSIEYAVEHLILSDKNKLSDKYKKYSEAPEAAENFAESEEYKAAQETYKENSKTEKAEFNMGYDHANYIVKTCLDSIDLNSEDYKDKTDEEIKTIIGDKILNNLKGEKTNKGDTLESEVKTIAAAHLEYLKAQQKCAEAQQTMDNLSGKAKEDAGNAFYDSILEELFPKDKEAQVNFKKRYPTPDAFKKRYGESIENAITEKNELEAIERTSS